MMKCDPESKRKPGEVYNTKLIVGFIFDDGAPLETAVVYALDFVEERARELGALGEWEDLCGRREKGQCLCDNHSRDNLAATPEDAVDRSTTMPFQPLTASSYIHPSMTMPFYVLFTPSVTYTSTAMPPQPLAASSDTAHPL